MGLRSGAALRCTPVLPAVFAHSQPPLSLSTAKSERLGQGPAGDTSGNSSGTKWAAANAIAEYADFGRRYTWRTDQVQRSFEDTGLKQRGLELVLGA
jgi:hypothetical protein